MYDAVPAITADMLVFEVGGAPMGDAWRQHVNWPVARTPIQTRPPAVSTCGWTVLGAETHRGRGHPVDDGSGAFLAARALPWG
jgi:hypothetical protein